MKVTSREGRPSESTTMRGKASPVVFQPRWPLHRTPSKIRCFSWLPTDTVGIAPRPSSQAAPPSVECNTWTPTQATLLFGPRSSTFQRSIHSVNSTEERSRPLHRPPGTKLVVKAVLIVAVPPSCEDCSYPGCLSEGRFLTNPGGGSRRPLEICFMDLTLSVLLLPLAELQKVSECVRQQSLLQGNDCRNARLANPSASRLFRNGPNRGLEEVWTMPTF